MKIKLSKHRNIIKRARVLILRKLIPKHIREVQPFQGTVYKALDKKYTGKKPSFFRNNNINLSILNTNV